ncbi:PfkB family carbohydrate kinase [Tropicimonas sp. IMCC6043]|uniref:PfkB family carbohydrate kinase n=1 Tax=Tropicimonas sp. IMCC6043 TaxID=2510645 RepID=UPI00101CA085|nr:PfkB family carbohydrate kinase [Tropicimonas sp. IMCC6043]RYH08622.1 sugar kinase [Tropicimonas sp. IMCC6043]
MSDVLVLGMAAVDFVLGIDEFPSEPTKYRARSADIVGGGPAANAAVAIARLGGHPSFVGRLGDDPLADIVLADLEAAGVSTDHVHRTPGGRSAFSSVLVDTNGERQVVNFRGEGLTEDADWIAALPRADAVLVDTRWPDGAAAALARARAWDVPGIVDGEAPIDPRLVAEASHLALSRQGLASLVPGEDLADALATLAARRPGWSCVTDGANGIWFTDGGGIAHLPAFRVDTVDTLAAGDVWHGAFALALAEARPEREAIRFANATAALKCMRFGGRSGTPDRATVETFLEETE